MIIYCQEFVILRETTNFEGKLLPMVGCSAAANAVVDGRDTARPNADTPHRTSTSKSSLYWGFGLCWLWFTFIRQGEAISYTSLGFISHTIDTPTRTSDGSGIF
jgi:hypothetical protein